MNTLQDEESETKEPGILDTVSFAQQNAYLRNFNPQDAISQHLARLEPREKQILSGRWGIEDGEPKTLEKIGKQVGLTRERIRQIEKDSFNKLNKFTPPTALDQGSDLIFQLIEERGGIIREDILLDIAVPNYQTPAARNGVIFILNLIPRFNLSKETGEFYRSWNVAGFDNDPAKKLIEEAGKLMEEEKTPMESAVLISALKQKTDSPDLKKMSDIAIDSYLTVSKLLDKNPFGEWGLASSLAIHPKDVGDKAFLVLAHHGSPEHYGKITELINKRHFDDRVANKESVHNELIKDARFVLVGRGIYALSEWGYKKGVVADIIREILRDSSEPLGRDQIIAKVLKQRLVKRNTIIVGLSNRKLFEKTQDDRYRLARQ